MNGTLLSIYLFLRKSKHLRKIVTRYSRIRYNRMLVREGEEKFSLEHPLNGSIEDFKRCVELYSASYDEYLYQFELWNKTEEERNEFMSQVSLRLLYSVLLSPEVEDIFWDKCNFLTKFNRFIHRDWLDMDNASPDEFKSFIQGKRIIAKPKKSSCGEGIFILPSVDDKGGETDRLFSRLRKGYILEECIENESSIKDFHPQSLNTIRIVTVKTSNDVEILGSFIRLGTGGNVVDNGGRNGILAMIDPSTGEVITSAYDKLGQRYDKHPDSGRVIKSFVIPKYHEMIEVCKAAANVIPEVKIIGWDVVLRNDGIVEIIEGNHRPDAYGLQTPLRKGYRSRLMGLLSK